MGWDRARGDVAYGLDVDVTRSVLPTGASDSTRQDSMIAELNEFVHTDTGVKTDSYSKMYGSHTDTDEWFPIYAQDGYYGIPGLYKLAVTVDGISASGGQIDTTSLGDDGIGTGFTGFVSPTFPHMWTGSEWRNVRGDTTYGLDVDVTRLPPGLAQETKQDTQIAQLEEIKNNTANIPPKGQTTKANSMPVVLPSDQTLTMEFTDDTYPETIYDLTLADSTIEYSYTLPSNCKEYEFQCEQNVDIRYSPGSGGTSTNYRTLKTPAAWSSWGRAGVNYANKTLYFKSPTQDNVIVQITIWTD